jgi:hypothetical protein
MYHPPSKRKQLTTRILISTLMTLSVVLLVVVLISVILGYQFNGKDGRIEQTGLVQFETLPSGATVEVDGKALSTKTTTKTSVLPGSHEFVMWRDGYETWRKSLEIQPGTLTALTYARLIPKDRTLRSVASFNELSDSLASPSKRSILLQTTPGASTFVLADLQNEQSIRQRTLSLPAEVYSEATTPDVTHRFGLVEWDQGGRYVLLTHSFNDSTEWLVLDTEDATRTTNITKSLNIGIDRAQFSGTSGSQLYVLSAGDVRKIDVAGGTISRPLASKVASFDLYGSDIIAYVSQPLADTHQQSVGVVREGDKLPHVLRTVVTSDAEPLHIATSRYFSEDYVAISLGGKVDILRGTYPSSTDATNDTLSQFASFTFSRPVEWLTISHNGRFVIAQAGDRFVSYDIERMSLPAEATLAGEGVATQLQWLDDFYAWSDRSGKLVLREYDGSNEYDMGAVATGFDATFSQNNRYLYSIGKTDSGYQLQRVRMILQ